MGCTVCETSAYVKSRSIARKAHALTLYVPKFLLSSDAVNVLSDWLYLSPALPPLVDNNIRSGAVDDGV